MELYLDMIFLRGLLFDQILLMITAKVLQVDKGKLRIFLGAIISSGLTLLGFLGVQRMAIFASGYGLYRFLCGLVTLEIAFGIRNIRQGFFGMVTLYGASFVLEGVCRFIKPYLHRIIPDGFPIVSLVGMGCFAYLFVDRFIALVKQHQQNRYESRPVLIRLGQREVNGRGLLDSGNSLVEPITHKPVVVVQKSLLTDNGIEEPTDGFFAIPFHTVGCEHGILKGFLADELHILDEEGEKIMKKVMLGIYEGRLSMRGEYQILLHPDLEI